jgi:hypothetical protein
VPGVCGLGVRFGEDIVAFLCMCVCVSARMMVVSWVDVYCGSYTRRR